MSHKLLIGAGVLLGSAIVYFLYKRLVDCQEPEMNIDNVEEINYEMLYRWLKQEYQNNKDGLQPKSKFGIMPSSLSRQAFLDITGHEINLKDGEDILCVFIIDDKEENLIARKFYVYKKMAQSLKDLLPKDKVYIQNLK